MKDRLQIEREGIEDLRAKMLSPALATLRAPTSIDCDCQKPQIVSQPPKKAAPLSNRWY